MKKVRSFVSDTKHSRDQPNTNKITAVLSFTFSNIFIKLQKRNEEREGWDGLNKSIYYVDSGINYPNQ